MPCKTCQHRKWVMLKQAGAHWTVMGCMLKKIRFGQESELALRKEDKVRKVVPMPVKCKDYSKGG